MWLFLHLRKQGERIMRVILCCFSHAVLFCNEESAQKAPSGEWKHYQLIPEKAY